MGRKRQQLRGQKLVLAIKAELGRMVNLSPKTDPISVSSLAKRLKISRQTIYSNGLDVVVSEFIELQQEQAGMVDEGVHRRRSLEDRLKRLEEENSDLKKRLDSYLERWVAVEYNARMLGVDADILFSTPQKPFRMIIRS